MKYIKKFSTAREANTWVDSPSYVIPNLVLYMYAGLLRLVSNFQGETM